MMANRTLFSSAIRWSHSLLGLCLVSLLAVATTSCEVEFSPNAEWKDVPVVYCVLDQDDDTTWVRVEKCFLGEGSIYQYGAVADSINYPEGSIIVRLLSYRYGSYVAADTLHYTLRPREEGNFASGMQPAYFTTTPLDESCTYSLEVIRASDGTLMADTDPIPLLINTESPLITKPVSTDRFKFYGNVGGSPVCQIEWNQIENARRYAPFIRFYYSEGVDTLYVDTQCPSVLTGNITGRMSINYSRNSFLSELKYLLQDDPNPKTYLEKVDIYLTACDENLSVYLSSINNGISLNQTSDTYSNIHGGMGVFAARRTHLYKSIGADNSIVPPNGLHYLLQQLGVGFE